MTQNRPNVVDLAAFRESRKRERLPLFDGTAEPAREPAEPGRVLTAPAALDDRAVAHRARMLEFLGGAMLSGCRT